MSDFQIITDGGRRRRWSAPEKLRIVEETLEDGASLSIVARRNGVAPHLLYRLRRLMLEGGSVAVSEDDDVTSNRVVRQLEERIRELKRHLGCKTLEAEILSEALDKSRVKNRPCCRCRRDREISGEGSSPDLWRSALEPHRPIRWPDDASASLKEGSGWGGLPLELTLGDTDEKLDYR